MSGDAAACLPGTWVQWERERDGLHDAKGTIPEQSLDIHDLLLVLFMFVAVETWECVNSSRTQSCSWVNRVLFGKDVIPDSSVYTSLTNNSITAGWHHSSWFCWLQDSLLQDSQHLAIFVTGRHDVMPWDDTFGIFWSCGSGDERASSGNFSQCTSLGVYGILQ